MMFLMLLYGAIPNTRLRQIVPPLTSHGITVVASEANDAGARAPRNAAPGAMRASICTASPAASSSAWLCATGTITRLTVVFAFGVTATCPIGLSSMGGVPATGGMRTYQAWYRDSSSSFCSASSTTPTVCSPSRSVVS